jgi:DNA-directed RNA polymerase subunit omega
MAGYPKGPTMIEPKIDDLLAHVDSKYTLVLLAAKRAREINSYYNQLGEGRAEFIPPLVETGLKSKPLSIALEEIAQGKINAERPEDVGIK